MGLMKKIILIIFVIININNSLLAADFVYNCNLDTQYKNGIEGEWNRKFVNFTISNSKDKYVKVYDHEIKIYYSPEMKIIKNNNDDFIFALSIDDYDETKPSLMTLSINKKTGYTQLVDLSGGGGSTLHFGYCK